MKTAINPETLRLAGAAARGLPGRLRTFYLLLFTFAFPVRLRSFYFLLFTFAFPVGAAGAQNPVLPLTEKQVASLSAGRLKKRPDLVLKLVQERKIAFLPTASVRAALKAKGVHETVLPELKQNLASVLRIRVCRFAGPQAAGEELARHMKEQLGDEKARFQHTDGTPLKGIPWDQTVAPPDGFDAAHKPDPGISYILIQGTLEPAEGGHRAVARIVYRALPAVASSTAVAPLGARMDPVVFGPRDTSGAAARIIRWSIQRVLAELQ